jgi:hypothetical protein
LGVSLSLSPVSVDARERSSSYGCNEEDDVREPLPACWTLTGIDVGDNSILIGGMKEGELVVLDFESFATLCTVSCFVVIIVGRRRGV